KRLAFLHAHAWELELRHERLYPWEALQRQAECRRRRRRRPLLGAHQSIAGGLHLALERGRAAGCEAVQIFTRSSRQWACRPLAEEDVRAFAAARAATGIDALLAHDSYLFNVAAPVAALRERSVRELIGELERCERLGIPYVVAHPGAHCGAGDDAGIRTAARSLGEILAACRGFRATIALENTAGEGAPNGWRLAERAGPCRQGRRGGGPPPRDPRP